MKVSPSFIPFNKALLTSEDIHAMTEVTKNGPISGNGPWGKAAEQLLSDMHDGASALLTTSCTHALEMSAELLELEPGDEVIVPAFTFVSTALAFVMRGAVPVFVDIRPDNLNINERLIEQAISPRTKAICVVNYAGFGVDFELILGICKKHGLTLVEDNAHGLGGKYRQSTLGTFGEISTLSFHETKNVTCGEGGAIIIRDASLVERAEILREKGTNRTRFFRGEVDKYNWVDRGSSWVQSEILAALLTSQLGRLNEVNDTRKKLWEFYRVGLADWARRLGIRLPSEAPSAEHTGHLFWLVCESEDQRRNFIAYMMEAQIQTVIHYQSLPDSEFGRRFTSSQASFPEARKASDTLVRLPLHLHVGTSEMTRIVETVTSFQG